MKKFLNSPDGTCKGAALIIVLALVVIATGLGLAYLSRTTTDRQLAQSSYHDTAADLLARSALDITVNDFVQEINNANAAGTPSPANIQPQRYGNDLLIPNLIRRSVYGDPTGRTSNISSTAAAASGRTINLTRWESHYLIPSGQHVNPNWVLVTGQGPAAAPTPGEVIGRYAFAVYDEGGLIDVNVGGFPTYAGLTRPIFPTRPGRRLPAKYPAEESEIMQAACQSPSFTPDHINVTLATGVPCSLLFNTNHNPTSFGVSPPNSLPRGLSISQDTGNITGIPTDPVARDITLTCSNACGGGTAILHLKIDGFPSPQTSPWPVNLARKGTVAFADLTALPSTPPLTFTPINKLMGWRNYATTQQPGAFLSNGAPWFPSGPPDDPIKDLYARYFLGAVPPFTTPFTGVPPVAWAGGGAPGPTPRWRTDQLVMTRQELVRLQKTLDNPSGTFPQSLLQYLGTFSRDHNRPSPVWPSANGNHVAVRFDMNNLQLLLPNARNWPGHYGVGHAYGLQRFDDVAGLFGLDWVLGTFAAGTRDTDPNYFGHWHYDQAAYPLTPLPAANPNFFQIIDYAMNEAIGVQDPNHVRNTFLVGAAIIDQYDSDDVWDWSDPNAATGNTITIIDYDGNPLNYAYGIESLSFHNPNDPNFPNRPPFAPYPPSTVSVPAEYALLNRRFENVGELGYAYSPTSTTAAKTLDFASAFDFAPARRNDRALLDFFTYNSASSRAGIVNLNTRNGPVLTSIISGALLNDPGYVNIPTSLVSQANASTAGNAIVAATTAANGAVVTRADVARLATVAAAALPGVLGASDEAKQTIARALAEVGQARVWNLMIDVIAQTGRYSPGTTAPLDNSNANKFIVEGEKRYWLHIALDRDDGTVLGSQLEEVLE
jgi:hypothetical protein